MSTFFSVALSVAVLAAFALTIGGSYLLIKRKERKQGLLMLLCAAVFFVNVLIWTLPAKG
jgi:high-affinity Fe2+/Pb2+ permease